MKQLSQRVHELNYRRMSIEELRTIAKKNKQEEKIFEKFDDKVIEVLTKRQLITILEIEAKYKIIKGEKI